MKSNIRTKAGSWQIFIQNKTSQAGKDYISVSIGQTTKKQTDATAPAEYETEFLNGFVSDLYALQACVNAAVAEFCRQEGQEAAERAAARKAENGNAAESGKYTRPSTKPVDNTPDPDDKIPF